MQGIEDFNETKPYLLMENVEKLNREWLNFYMVGFVFQLQELCLCALVCMYQLWIYICFYSDRLV